MSILESTRKMTTNEKMCYDMGYAQGKQDAMPVVRGEWILNEDMKWACSSCGGLAIEHPNKSDKRQAITAYCPNCGAKMESEGNT